MTRRAPLHRALRHRLFGRDAAALLAARAGRARALLAAGLVLGVGATVTLAAWNDQENAAGSFGTSVFNTVSKDTADTVFASHDQSAATLAFAATGMSPGALFAAGLDVRTTGAADAPVAASTVGGTVLLTANTPSGDALLTGELEYRAVVTTTATACSAASYPATFTAAGAIPAGIQATVAAGGASTARFCVQIRLKTDAPNTTQGRSGTLTWAFTSTSS